MFNILWGIVVVLIAFWGLGLALHIAGNLIHAVLLLAIGLAIYNFFKGRDVSNIVVPDVVRYISKVTNLGKKDLSVPQLLKKRYILPLSN